MVQTENTIGKHERVSSGVSFTEKWRQLQLAKKDLAREGAAKGAEVIARAKGWVDAQDFNWVQGRSAMSPSPDTVFVTEDGAEADLSIAVERSRLLYASTELEIRSATLGVVSLHYADQQNDRIEEAWKTKPDGPNTCVQMITYSRIKPDPDNTLDPVFSLSFRKYSSTSEFTVAPSATGDIFEHVDALLGALETVRAVRAVLPPEV